ncbi:MAG: fructose-bisphosphatase class II, partial [Pirellulales bacterium]
AAAIKGLGGEQLCRVWANDDEGRAQPPGNGKHAIDDPERIWNVGEMACGDNIVFVATGISDASILRGVRKHSQHWITHSLLVSSRTKAIRFVETYHEVAERPAAGPHFRDFEPLAATSLA